MSEYCQGCKDRQDEIAALREELDIWKSVFPDIAPRYVLSEPQAASYAHDPRDAELYRWRSLGEAIIENDPDDAAADAVTALDVWRKEAGDLLSASQAMPETAGRNADRSGDEIADSADYAKAQVTLIRETLKLSPIHSPATAVRVLYEEGREAFEATRGDVN
jgi:hypothetical protein